MIVRLKEAEINKGIEDGVSPLCQQMHEFLKGSRVPQNERYNKTSIDQRRNLRSQAGNRLMGMTTGNFRKSEDRRDAILEESEVSDIIESYKIEEEIIPRMRMKWKSAHEQSTRVDDKDISTIGSNNIHLLSYAIPEIENSIRRLSFQRSPKSPKEREF
jgi:hypothetical protein